MAAVKKINSNAAQLSYAEEASPKVLPGSPVWQPLLPNSFSEWGGSITKAARSPIVSDRQRRKGQVTDLEAAGTMNHDLVQGALQDLFQGFFFADFRRKVEFGGAGEITSVDNATSVYGAASGLDGFKEGDLVMASGFAAAVNNGLKRVTSSAAAALEVAEILEDDAAPNTGAKLVAAGFQFDAGDIGIDVTGDLPQLFTTAKDVDELGLIPGEIIFIGGDTAATQFNGGERVASFVIANGGTGYTADDIITMDAGVAGTVATVKVLSVDGVTGEALTAEIAEPGVYAEVPTNPVSTTGGTGTGCTLTVTWEPIGGSNYGFARVRAVDSVAKTITLDKTAMPFVNDAGVGKTVQIFLGRVLKNEVGTDIVRRTYQFERTLGAPDDAAPSQIQSEYLIGAVPNELTISVPTADIAKLDMAFMAMDAETRSGTVGVKAGDRLTSIEEEAYNTSSNVPRVNIAVVSDTDSCPDPLFAYAQEITLTVNNNVTLDKAVGVLGGFDFTDGNFDVGGSMTVYFADVATQESIRNNDTVTLDIHLVKDNAGISFDIPALTISDGRPDVQLNQPITLPLTNEACKGSVAVDGMDHTLLAVFFDYLPSLA